MTFGKDIPVAPLILNNKPIEFVSQWTYLGITVTSGCNFNVSTCSELSSFYRSYNSLLTAVQKPNNLVLMNLLYSNCIPSLTYAAEVKDVPNREMQNLNVALNNAIRRIFSYNRWESTRLLRQQLGYPNVTEIFQKRRRRFIAKSQQSELYGFRFADFWQ